ncbi:MAG TPA: valine--tRNA ligase, partial [Sulfitobacter sp.]|nr:valine--tRNA ligase [Sulfitobacter sp.]
RSGEVTILPEQDRKVYFHWLENIEPWCISRQLWWGHQIPVWFDHEGNEYCASTSEEAVAKVKERFGDEVQVELREGSSSFVKSGGKLVSVGIYRDPDVLDTWFSSGLWPIGTLGWPEQTAELEKYFPTSVLVTGFDI